MTPNDELGAILRRAAEHRKLRVENKSLKQEIRRREANHPFTCSVRRISSSRSRSEIPEATVWVDVDATALWSLREAARTPDEPGPGLLAYIARFVVAGLPLDASGGS